MPLEALLGKLNLKRYALACRKKTTNMPRSYITDIQGIVGSAGGPPQWMRPDQCTLAEFSETKLSLRRFYGEGLKCSAAHMSTLRNFFQVTLGVE